MGTMGWLKLTVRWGAISMGPLGAKRVTAKAGLATSGAFLVSLGGKGTETDLAVRGAGRDCSRRAKCRRSPAWVLRGGRRRRRACKWAPSRGVGWACGEVSSADPSGRSGERRKSSPGSSLAAAEKIRLPGVRACGGETREKLMAKTNSTKKPRAQPLRVITRSLSQTFRPYSLSKERIKFDRISNKTQANRGGWTLN